MSLNESLIPHHINPLAPNGFNFKITKIPGVSFFCQRVMVPSLSITSVDRATPFATVPIPGEIMTFGELSIQFLVDEKLENYKSIVDWMIGLTYPESHEQYQRFIGSDQTGLISELTKNYSDGLVEILDSQNRPTNTFRFYDMFPISLDPIQMEATVMDTNYIIGAATFKYSYFDFDTHPIAEGAQQP